MYFHRWEKSWITDVHLRFINFLSETTMMKRNRNDIFFMHICKFTHFWVCVLIVYLLFFRTLEQRRYQFFVVFFYNKTFRSAFLIWQLSSLGVQRLLTRDVFYCMRWPTFHFFKQFSVAFVGALAHKDIIFIKILEKKYIPLLHGCACFQVADWLLRGLEKSVLLFRRWKRAIRFFSDR